MIFISVTKLHLQIFTVKFSWKIQGPGSLFVQLVTNFVIRKAGIQEIKKSFRVKVRMPVWVIDKRLRLNIFGQMA